MLVVHLGWVDDSNLMSSQACGLLLKLPIAQQEVEAKGEAPQFDVSPTQLRNHHGHPVCMR